MESKGLEKEFQWAKNKAAWCFRVSA